MMTTQVGTPSFKTLGYSVPITADEFFGNLRRETNEAIIFRED